MRQGMVARGIEWEGEVGKRGMERQGALLAVPFLSRGREGAVRNGKEREGVGR